MSDSNNRRGEYGYGSGYGSYNGGGGYGAFAGGGPQGTAGFMRRNAFPGAGIGGVGGGGGGSGGGAGPGGDNISNNKNNSNNNNKNSNSPYNDNYYNQYYGGGNYNDYHHNPSAGPDIPNENGRRPSGNPANEKPPTFKSRRHYSEMQPTVEDVPDEDDIQDRKSNASGSSVTDLDPGNSKASMAPAEPDLPKGTSKQNKNHYDPSTDVNNSNPKRKPSVEKRSQTAQPSSQPQRESSSRRDSVKRSQGKHRDDSKHKPKTKQQPAPAPPAPPTPEEDEVTPEIAPRESMPYGGVHTSGKREEIARGPDHLTPKPGGSRSTPYTYTPNKKDSENGQDIIRDRERRQYSSVKPERTKSATSAADLRDNDPILTQSQRTRAPYSQTYPSKTPPPPMASNRKSSHPPPPPPPETQRKPSQYSYVPQKPSTGSENSGTPIKRQPSKGRGEARSRPTTPGGPRTPREYADDGDYGDPIVATLKEGAERRSPAPYAYTPPGSISSATSHKLQSSPSQGSYSQIPQNLQSSGSLKRATSPAASYSSSGSGHHPHAASPYYPPSRPPPPMVNTAAAAASGAGGYAPFAPDAGDFTHSHTPHPSSYSQYHFPYQQSPISYASPATPMWISEPDPGPPCPESTQIPWGAWYHPPYAPKFTICEGCYRKYIALTPFAPHFARIDVPKPGSGVVVPQKTVLRACMFHSSLTRKLWQNMCNTQAYHQQQNLSYQQSAAVFYAYAQRRAELVPCAGPVGVKPPQSREQHAQWPRWWASPNFLPSFLICEACFADYMNLLMCIPPEKVGTLPPAVSTSPYMQYFQPFTLEAYLRQNPATMNGELPVWVCDVGSNMLIKHLLEEANKPPEVPPTSSWDHFVQLARWRLMDARPCPGQHANEQSDQALVMAGGRRWYRCTRELSKDDLVVCEACYYDMLVPAGISHEFVEIWVSGHEIQPHCHLSMMEYRFPLSMAKETKDYTIFWDAASWGLGLRKCDDRGYVLGNSNAVTSGVPGGVEWYVLFSGPEETAKVLMECCPRCYQTFIKPSTFGDHFDRVLPGLILDRGRPGQNGQVPARSSGIFSASSAVLDVTRLRICDLISTPQVRWQRIFFKLLEAAHQRDFTILTNWLWTSAKLTPCARDAVVYKPSPSTMGTAGQRWYSTPGEEIVDTIVACEECYHGFIRGTALEVYFSDITEGIIHHLSNPVAEREIILLCSLYSSRQRELLDRCLRELSRYPEDEEGIVDLCVAPLVEASTRRFQWYVDMRKELMELEQDRREAVHVVEAQMGGLRLDADPYSPQGGGLGADWAVMNRYRDVEERVAALNARWKEEIE